MYREGRGVPQDDERAYQWIIKVAKRGYAAARINVAFMWRDGVGVG